MPRRELAFLVQLIQSEFVQTKFNKMPPDRSKSLLPPIDSVASIASVDRCYFSNFDRAQSGKIQQLQQGKITNPSKNGEGWCDR